MIAALTINLPCFPSTHLPSLRQMFCALLLLSTLFFTLALTVGISLIYARPQKFAICFTCGSLTFMSSFAVLRGPMDHIRGMLAPDRLLFTSIYVGSMAATLHFTFRKGGVRGYIYVLSCSALQIVALLWYLISFVPGGSAGLQVLVGAMIRMLRPILLGCIKMWSRLLRSLVGWLSR